MAISKLRRFISCGRCLPLLPVLGFCIVVIHAHADVTGLTAGGVDLATPPDSTEEVRLRYGLGFPFQVSPERAAVFCNVRIEGIAVTDYENGTDVIIFEDLATISAANAVAISRNERRADADGKARLVVKFPVIGGFVPLGALRADGSAHPHAGTGFGICQAISFPVDEAGHFNWKTERIHRCEVHQFAYDGRRFSATRSASGHEQPHPSVKDSGWDIISPGITTAIPDGDDLLQAAAARNGSGQISGVLRWTRVGPMWEPVRFTPVTPAGESWSEASVIRDVDGALLFSARGSGGPRFTEVRVWRMRDAGPQWRLVFSTPDVRVLHREAGGPEWKQVISAAKARNSGPMSIGRAADGTPFIGANLSGSGRDTLCLWPLNPARSGLEEPHIARAAHKEFGSGPAGSRWMVDHPSGAVLRLRDGNWHGVLVYRILGQAEHKGVGPAVQSGCYVEETLCTGSPSPPWRFE
ncbi:MAG: hypothetical protein HN742_12440 [Lentisphaerae bacterium]|jgi:hypothetical protein|nr:hypothetical protein [Lentisphaerota bacterium]MBT4819700.1 hypothetical protein [Lentisphaerota bacterium]MBT5605639.1 hypothetical protein [Lentisphaerota bacterium]MBT7054443.1 hypothetical protein [Lentisphaerota bacterium]MBT7842677.1 hypothetical protein [Lentisphaerota bacterium]